MYIPFLNRVSSLDKILFAKHLALMIKAGLPLRESISTIGEQSESKTLKRVLAGVVKNIDNGQSLADSLSNYPRTFDAFCVNMIRLGEESGTLEGNLKRLSLQLEKNYILKGNVRAAMLYPAIVLGLVMFLSVGLTFFVLPKITPIFKTFNIQLPFATRTLILFSEFVQKYGFYVLIFLVFSIFTTFVLYRIRAVRFFVHKIILKLPIIGKISRNLNISYFSRNLGTLLKSGLSLTNALDTSKEVLGNLVYQKELESLQETVKTGRQISDFLKERKATFPLMVSQMVGVGENTGNLEETFLYLGDFYEEEVEKSIKNLSTTLEPALLIIIGFAVGFVALAIITPIYEITRGLHL